jgi:hypothetical protein
MKHEELIVVDQDGVSLLRARDNACFWELRWVDVKEIVAWKDDVWSYDIICMGFRLGEAPHYLWCDEECAGWKELEAKVAQLPGTQTDWWSKVAFPAFVSNWTTIWGQRPADANIVLLAHTSPGGFPVEGDFR